ncbi:malonyl-CoA decarboxylase-domain-containing protein [Chytriomyces sp. MP71]|nr:malonyl-CoA decarboxylase-domain-containing protein [Chytriomyces sp. MP71]
MFRLFPRRALQSVLSSARLRTSLSVAPSALRHLTSESGRSPPHNPHEGDIKDRIVLKATKSIDTTAIEKYWQDVMRTDKDPDYTFDLKAAHLGSCDEIAIVSKRLLEGAIAGGDSSFSRMKTFECADFYNKLDQEARKVFLSVLAKEYGPNHATVLKASESLQAAAEKGGDKSLVKLEAKLRDALEPPYLKFFMQLYHHPGGMRFLLKIREDLIAIVSKNSQDTNLKDMNDRLKDKVQGWFGIAFLDLERITWTSPAAILEKLIKYEAVHAIPSWDALKERLLPGRACFAFFHKGMPLEPLAFVHVSFENDIQRNVQTIIQNPPAMHPEDASVAIFYTISSPQKGLSGIDLGNFLIKRVVKEIQARYPNIQTFTTLSPIPGFRNWLEMQLNLPTANSLLLVEEQRMLATPGMDAISVLKNLLEDDKWIQNSLETVRIILTRLCSRYILLEKKRSFALDPVANFHIRNGACVYQLNWMGDTSEKGIAQSYGIMINYLYDLEKIEENNDLYVRDGMITVFETAEDAGLRWAVAQPRGSEKVRVVGRNERARL